MSLLFPAMLLGLLGLAIPVALHWIARSRFPEQPFPSIRLLRLEQRHNVFSRRLVDPLQLLLRLLVGLLLVLAMARLFAPWFGGRAAPRNLVVVLDASASMRTEVADPAGGSRVRLLDLAAQRAAELLKAVEPPGRTAVIAAGDEIRVLAPLRAGHAGSVAALGAAAAGDGTGPGLLRAVADACDLVRGRREVRAQVVVFTDLRASAFETRRQADLQRIEDLRRSLGRALEIWFVDVARGSEENAAIVEARVRGGEVRLGDDAHVLTRVLNAGAAEREVALRLDLGGKTAAQARPVTLAAGGEAVFDLTAPMNRPVRTFGEAQLAVPDAAPLDDRRLVPVNVVDATRVLIVRGAVEAPGAPGALERLGGGAASAEAADAGEAIDGATVLRYVLNPGRELGLGYSTGIEPALTSVDAFGAQPLSKYDVVVLYDVDQLPERALEDLDAFVRGGKSVLFFCSAGCSPVRFNRFLAAGAGTRAALAPARLGNEREYPQAVGLEADPAGLLAPFRDRLQGDLSVVRFSRLRELQGLADGARVVMSAADGLPLAVEARLEQGRVILLTFGLELDRGNVARTRVFPVLMWRLVDALTGRDVPRRPDILPAAAPAVLDVSEPAFAFETELELAAGGVGATGEVRRLAITPERTVLLPALPSGAYALSKPRREAGAVVSYQRPLAVNPDARESRMERLGTNELLRLAGPATKFAAVDRVPDLTVRGRELWFLLVVLLVLAYIAEGVVGFLTSARRERAAPGGGGAP